MFHRRDENLVATLYVGVAPAASDQVDAGGSARSEDDFARMLSPNKVANLFAGFFVLLGAPFAQRMNAAMDIRIIALIYATQHFNDLPRPLSARGVIEKYKGAVAVDRLRKDR